MGTRPARYVVSRPNVLELGCNMRRLHRANGTTVQPSAEVLGSATASGIAPDEPSGRRDVGRGTVKGTVQRSPVVDAERAEAIALYRQFGRAAFGVIRSSEGTAIDYSRYKNVDLVPADPEPFPEPTSPEPQGPLSH